METKNVTVFIFVNQLYYGKVEWPRDGISLRIRLTDNKGKVGFLGSCKPEKVSGYGSTSVAEGKMYIMSLGIKAEYTLIDNITINHSKNELDIAIRKEV